MGLAETHAWYDAEYTEHCKPLLTADHAAETYVCAHSLTHMRSLRYERFLKCVAVQGPLRGG